MSQAERLTGTGFALAVHGGAGTIPRDEAGRSRAASYHDGVRRALTAGRDILAAGGRALNAVTEAVAALEDDLLFNAGRGSVFTRVGTQEMDACVMDGTERRAGAVAGIFGPRNPVLAARAVMQRSRHVL
jgi:beta-aspartyl-peptidase (threonine type)